LRLLPRSLDLEGFHVPVVTARLPATPDPKLRLVPGIKRLLIAVHRAERDEPVYALPRRCPGIEGLLDLHGSHSVPLCPEETSVTPIRRTRSRSIATTHTEVEMLILTRRPNETLYVGDDVRITVLSVNGAQVRLGIEAPRSGAVDRDEIYERKQAEAAPAHPPRLPGDTAPHRRCPRRTFVWLDTASLEKATAQGRRLECRSPSATKINDQRLSIRWGHLLVLGGSDLSARETGQPGNQPLRVHVD